MSRNVRKINKCNKNGDFIWTCQLEGRISILGHPVYIILVSNNARLIVIKITRAL